MAVMAGMIDALSSSTDRQKFCHVSAGSLQRVAFTAYGTAAPCALCMEMMIIISVLLLRAKMAIFVDMAI
jgi:hypothetical protein